MGCKQAATTAIEWLFEWDASMHGRTDNLIPYSETDRITPRPAACGYVRPNSIRFQFS